VTGWSIRSLEQIGKTEVLCRSAEALHRLKAHAESIPSSDVYPSFHPDLGHSLFFFDTRLVFVEWLRQYAEAMPIEPAPPVAAPAAVKGARRVRFKEFAAAAMLLLLLGGLFFVVSPHIIRADVVEPLPASDVVETDAEPIITVTIDESSEAETTAAVAVPGDSPTTAAAIDSPPPRPRPAATGGQLKIWFVDVGQGDGIIIRLPDGGVVVIDANRRGAATMLPILQSLGVRTLRAVVMTHPHADHLGDLGAILDRYPTETFYDPGYAHTTAGYMQLLRTVEKQAKRYVIPKSGDRLDWGRGVTVTVLASGGHGDVNNNSIVLKIDFGRTSVILTGDAEKESEREILDRFRGRLAAEVLKVGHHGSRTSSTPDFLRAVAPKYAIISCGVGNTYGHPNPQTMRNLEAIRARIFRTDVDGTILAISDGRAFTVGPAR
jgi:competence protein ComEC